MERNVDLNGFLENKQNFIPHLSIDSVIFGFHQDQLKVLLLRVHDSGYGVYRVDLCEWKKVSILPL
jgi:hypothetical protein